MALAPADVPHIYALTRDSLRSPFITAYLAMRVRDGNISVLNAQHPLDAAQAYIDAEWKRLSGSTLFYVSHDMVDLAVHASMSTPDWQLRAEDLPAPNGFMVFANPVLGALDPSGNSRQHYGAVSWAEPDALDGPLFGGAGVRSTWYTDRDAQEVSESASGGSYFSPAEAPPFVLETIAWNRFGENNGLVALRSATSDELVTLEASDVLQHYTKTKVLITLWRLMRQQLSTSSPLVMNGAQRKQARRNDIDPDRIRIIRLRHRSAATGSGDIPRNYLHRWIVNGHWRNHWHPREGRHVPTWIAPYVKGPEGAPLLTGEKVYALVQ